jgi:hypothetical protein
MTLGTGGFVRGGAGGGSGVESFTLLTGSRGVKNEIE